ncbi:sperm acrosome membrane-associated protein 4-like [Myotis myotis]|uniref:sperm acrosome membrane-associated protein 4-like n=1 Tax=Myotis myotis TaxID=51298 RepID=UPI00174D495E|nr:sperm acrosome membrane-associated protein 4-like [Myotis myotis]
MVLSWLLLLVMALPTVMTGIKMCIFCDVTDSSSICPGILMTCGNDEQCFTGQGMIPGLGPVTNKGCMLSTSCSRRVEPVIYQGVTYKFNSTCCDGELCNRAPIPAGSLKAAATTCLALDVLLLLQ